MPMPSASLTLGDKVLIRIVSGTFFAVSSFWCGHERIRSVGIACFPLGFALFSKCTRPFASPETRAKLAEEHRERETNKKKNSQQIDFFEDPLDDPSFSQKSLVWSVIQIVCAVSGLFDWYPSVVVKSALVFHILLTVQDSIETRPEELQRKRNEKLRLESALFWKFFLPAFFWKWMGYKTIVDAATKSSASSKNGSSSSKNNDDDDPYRHLNATSYRIPEHVPFDHAVHDSGNWSPPHRAIIKKPDAGVFETENLVRRGLYSTQLKWWLKRYTAGEDLLVVNYKDLVEDTRSVYERVLGFAGIPLPANTSAIDFDKRARTDKRKEDRPLAAETRRYLEEFYAPHNAELEELLGEEWSPEKLGW
mmetsp:Transcript_13467/g.31119  ORF Transcript_13467/g.31119 Transcript_13467/m.31119 type:complete len:364 (-) Transcript_13467:203-1294(-)